MQPKSLLALSLAVIALGAFIFFYEKELPSTDERNEQAKKVLRLAAETIDSIQLEWDGHEVRLERQPPAEAEEDEEPGEVKSLTTFSSNSWHITSPFAARADANAVDSLVRSLVGLEANRTLEEDFARGELGLDEPRARVTLVSEDGQSVLEIGAEVPASSDMIVAVAGRDSAYKVAGTVFDDLTKEPGEWRDKKLFTHSRGEIDGVTLTGETGESIRLGLRGEDLWIESPLTDRADEERVNALISQLTGLRAEAFIDEPLLTPEALGLEPARGLVEVRLAGSEQPFRFELGLPTDATEEGASFYGRVERQMVELETQLVDSLALSAAEWRSTSWASMQVFKVETARLEDAEGVLEVSRDGADWKRGEDRIAYSVVSDLLYPITEAKGEQVLEREQVAALGHDLTTPVLELLLTTKDGEEELALYDTRDGLAAATTGSREAVLLIAQDKVDEILTKLSELRTAEAMPEVPEEPEGGTTE